jgi:dTDP-4-dehydrorhamnose 3,5-epimerase
MNKSLFIPKGFAHGYQTLSTKSDILYLHSGHHNPMAESGLNYADPKLSIEWPLPVSEVSIRDSSFEFLNSRGDLF